MRIRRIQLEHIKIPLLITHSQANHEANYSDSVLVKIETAKGIVGYGESCPRPYVTGESVRSVTEDIRGIEQQLLTLSIEDLKDIKYFVCEKLAIGNAAICGLELALLDAWSKENGQYITSILEGKVQPILDYSGVIPLNGSKVSDYILEAFEFKSIKIKVGKDLVETCGKIETLINRFGKELAIRVDVNCGWNIGDAIAQIPILRKLGVTSFEQLFPKGKEQYWAKAMQIFGKEVILLADESVIDLKSAQHLIDKKLCNGFNLKISKHGGIFKTLQIYELAQKNGISCQLGAHFGETSILTAAGVALSSLAPQLKFREGAFGTFLLEADLCERPLQIDQKGMLKFPRYGMENGLGIKVDLDLVKAYAHSLYDSDEPKSISLPKFFMLFGL